jgi:hypothetical protein
VSSIPNEQRAVIARLIAVRTFDALEFGAGYAKYTDVEKNNVPLKTPGPTTQMIGDLPYHRLQRPVWFPDRHDGVTEPTVRRFYSAGAVAEEAEEGLSAVAGARL